MPSDLPVLIWATQARPNVQLDLKNYMTLKPEQLETVRFTTWGELSRIRTKVIALQCNFYCRPLHVPRANIATLLQIRWPLLRSLSLTITGYDAAGSKPRADEVVSIASFPAPKFPELKDLSLNGMMVMNLDEILRGGLEYLSLTDYPFADPCLSFTPFANALSRSRLKSLKIQNFIHAFAPTTSHVYNSRITLSSLRNLTIVSQDKSSVQTAYFLSRVYLPSPDVMVKVNITHSTSQMSFKSWDGAPVEASVVPSLECVLPEQSMASSPLGFLPGNEISVKIQGTKELVSLSCTSSNSSPGPIILAITCETDCMQDDNLRVEAFKATVTSLGQRLRPMSITQLTIDGEFSAPFILHRNFYTRRVRPELSLIHSGGLEPFHFTPPSRKKEIDWVAVLSDLRELRILRIKDSAGFDPPQAFAEALRSRCVPSNTLDFTLICPYLEDLVLCEIFFHSMDFVRALRESIAFRHAASRNAHPSGARCAVAVRSLSLVGIDVSESINYDVKVPRAPDEFMPRREPSTVRYTHSAPQLLLENNINAALRGCVCKFNLHLGHSIGVKREQALSRQAQLDQDLRQLLVAMNYSRRVTDRQ